MRMHYIKQKVPWQFSDPTVSQIFLKKNLARQNKRWSKLLLIDARAACNIARWISIGGVTKYTKRKQYAFNIELDQRRGIKYVILFSGKRGSYGFDSLSLIEFNIVSLLVFLCILRHSTHRWSSWASFSRNIQSRARYVKIN